MKRFVLIAIAALSLVGCKNESNTVDCEFIKVTKGQDILFKGEHYESYSKVFKYSDEEGDAIYLDGHIYNIHDGSLDVTVRLYENKESQTYKEYNYVGYIGYLNYDENFIYDKKAKTIDSVIIWSTFTRGDKITNPTEAEMAKNPRTLEYVKKGGYYHFDDHDINTDNYIGYYLDKTDSSIERHSLYEIPEDCEVTYLKKK